jgi:O-antigen/teichoic acid export membrane protein
MFKRIVKSLGALAAGHGIQTLTQLLVAPAFIAAYGVSGYGEWLVLSAAVGYLGTLDFGLQTCVLNELTALYHRRDMERFHRVQSVGLALTLSFTALGALLAACVFLLPTAGLLKVTGSESSVAWTVFWLALQILAGIPLGQIIGIYRTFGQAHRGVMWGNLYRMALLAVTLGSALLRFPFWLVAMEQVVVVLAATVTVVVCLKRSHPDVCPRLNYWDGKLALQILKPSAFFVFFILNQFIIFQAPLLLLHQAFGAGAVVGFAVSRTLFSFVRQGSSLLQAAIAPEVTRLDGIGDKERLVRVYLFSESVVLASALVVNVGLLLMSPTILWLWLGRPELFDLKMFTLMMLVAILMSVKDYKLYFQYATNRHANTALVTFLSYSAAMAIAVPFIREMGINGLLGLWASVELLQVAFLHFYNTQFLVATAKLSVQPAIRLLIALGAVVAVLAPARAFLQSQEFFLHTIVAVCVVAVLSWISYFLFGLKDILGEWKVQLARLRLAREPQRAG